MTPRAAATPMVALLSATMFLSAFLMFLVEPIVAKVVLPGLGGAPMVWNTCVVFFQTALLAGYAAAHGARASVGSRRSGLLYGLLLLTPVALLPFVIPTDSISSVTNPIPSLFFALVKSIGLPFLVLAATAPTLQALLAATDDPAARDPYFLYAASNVGSLGALAAYPTVVETTLRLTDQIRLWAYGYGAFVLLALVSVVVTRRHMSAAPERKASPEATLKGSLYIKMSWRRRARWVILAFVPSSLMLGVTQYLSTDIAAFPLLWIVPLALYLLTFIVAFGSRGAQARSFADWATPLIATPLAVMLVWHADEPAVLLIPLHLAAFTIVGLLCHGALANDRPSPEHLTEFYFWLACGGMLGGMFNTLVAPVVFKSVLEYPIVLAIACWFREPREPQTPDLGDGVVPIGLGLLAVVLTVVFARSGVDARLVIILPAALCFSQLTRPRRFALGLGALLAVGLTMPEDDPAARSLHAERTFFGVYRVGTDATGRYRVLFHGTTIHGLQALDTSRQDEPLTYYHRSGPAGEAFAALPPAPSGREVAVIGLGAGSLAAYAAPLDRWTFYEIDPAVERIARNEEYFTYLRTCGDRCRVVLGDARRSLVSAPLQQYGLLVLDAFSSDAIPTHLLTSEALALYLSRLRADGVIMFHISNRHMTLGPVVARLAMRHGLTALERSERLAAEVSPEGKSGSQWVVMARQASTLGSLVASPRWAPPAIGPETPLWTDDFTNILSVLRLR